MTSFSFGSSSVTLVPNSGVQVSLPATTCSLTMNWHYHANDLDINGSGSSDDNLQIALTALVNIVNSNGKPLMTVSSLSVDITKMDIQVHGGASWFYQTFVNIFKGTIHDLLQKSISSELDSIISSVANNFVNEVNLNYILYPYISVDYSLTSNAEFSSQFSATNHKGVFTWIRTGDTCSYGDINLPLDLTTSPITFVVSYAMLDCVSKLLYDRGLFNVTLVPDMVPDQSPIHLNTSDANLKRLIPNLYENFPNRGLQVFLSPQSPPIAQMWYNDQTGPLFEITALGNFDVFVQEDFGVLKPAFSFETSLQVLFKISFNNGNLTCNIQNYMQETQVTNTFIGPVNSTNVANIVNFFIGFGVVPELNKYMAVGIPIPSVNGVSLVNPQIDYGSYYLMLGTDFSYTAPSPKEKKTTSINVQSL